MARQIFLFSQICNFQTSEADCFAKARPPPVNHFTPNPQLAENFQHFKLVSSQNLKTFINFSISHSKNQ